MALPALAVVGLGMQAATSIFGGIKAAQQLKEAKKINPFYQKYEASPYAKQMLGRAQQQVNARSPFAEAQRRSILSSQANVGSNIRRGAVDPSMAMAGLLASQAMGDQAMNQQFIMDNQMQAQREANLMAGQQAMTLEGDKVYADMMNKYKMDLDRKTALRQAGVQGIMNAGSSLASTAFGAQGLLNSTKMNQAQIDYLNRQ